ncbi:putative chromosome segregation protein [Phaeoacremonium minimum UCRPA7]|uniref:Putative chromosome segregation protein n=1 Tax=Phaeoacremonium minimum (strain UCR-PA7) TaxID=1286976 RepID=R8BQ63_PHAM7|nr:putative chromosome segregation protein [Phaeoacremonium minimum UCRPA7]EOO01420.1 putative chromosome segregation protein [Phaeoacremonium minimum UCRPA7]
MTKKYESLEMKYRDLRDVAVREAERNFDRLKKQGEERAQTANQLIANLKSEVTAQKELAKEGASFKKQFEASEAKIDNLQARITELTTALSESKNEMKTLSAKLSAARATEAANAKVPGSAMKNGTGGSRAAASSETVHSTQLAQLKEDLYGDLTGLIVRGVKRDGPEDTFDCIQTGRGRTLHFKLAIANENSSEGYDDAQFMYMPQLDPKRDEDLIEMLPDYLVEEISFPRLHAAKFYSRVQKALTERLD